MKLVKCISCKGKKQNQPLKIGKIYEILETKNLMRCEVHTRYAF